MLMKSWEVTLPFVDRGEKDVSGETRSEFAANLMETILELADYQGVDENGFVYIAFRDTEIDRIRSLVES